VRTHAIQYVISQANRYYDTVQPLAEALVIGSAWGSQRHNALWRHTIEAVARLAAAMPLGQQVQQLLLELRSYPTLLLVYSAGLAGVYKENWTALRAVTTDAQTRDETARKIPVIGITNVWMPFRSIQLAAQVLAVQAGGAPLSDADIEALRTGTRARRHTPVSDHLHDRLRPLLSPIIPDDSEYDDVFDELEVLLAVIATDAAEQADKRGQYLHGAWVGAFTWRQRYERPSFEEQVWARRREALLSAGFFGDSADRADRAFEKFAAEVRDARSRRS